MTRDPNIALKTLLFGTDEHPVNISRMSAKLKISRSALHKWKENPGLIQVHNLRRMARYLGIEWEDIGRAIGGMK